MPGMHPGKIYQCLCIPHFYFHCKYSGGSAGNPALHPTYNAARPTAPCQTCINRCEYNPPCPTYLPDKTARIHTACWYNSYSVPERGFWCSCKNKKPVWISHRPESPCIYRIVCCTAALCLSCPSFPACFLKPQRPVRFAACGFMLL